MPPDGVYFGSGSNYRGNMWIERPDSSVLRNRQGTPFERSAEPSGDPIQAFCGTIR